MIFLNVKEDEADNILAKIENIQFLQEYEKKILESTAGVIYFKYPRNDESCAAENCHYWVPPGGFSNLENPPF